MKNVSRYIVAGAAATLLPFAIAVAQSPSPDQTSPPAAREPTQGQGTTFESLDADSDGRISKSEAEVNATVKSRFSSYDVNGDGFIERAEVTQANKSQSEPQQ